MTLGVAQDIRNEPQQLGRVTVGSCRRYAAHIDGNGVPGAKFADGLVDQIIDIHFAPLLDRRVSPLSQDL